MTKESDPEIVDENERNAKPRTPGRQIRVLIVDDHVMLAESLRGLIDGQPDLEVTGVAHDVQGAVDVAAQSPPDVVLMDYGIPDGDGLRGARLLKEQHAGVTVLVFSGYGSASLVAEAIEAGCDGFVRKTASGDELLAAIRRAASGEAVFSATDLLAATQLLRSPKRGVSELSERELEVLQLLVGGASTDAIAASLFVSSHTVRSHVRHILEKLGAHSKLEAVAIALRTGIIAPPS